MNTFERKIYNLLRHNAELKKKVRNIYQRFFDLIPPKPSTSKYSIIARENHFFGFHDHTPFSYDNRKLLSCYTSIPLRMPLPNEPLCIGYFDGPTYEDFHPLTQTKAWMWHTGCKLQWRGDTHQIVFNDHECGCNIARIYDTHTGKTQTLDDPIASVSPDGLWAVGYSFERAEKYMPGYGYIYDTGEKSILNQAPDDTGIYRIDLNNAQKKLLISINDLVNLDPDDSMKDKWHYVTHAVFSPDSKRFIFLHRWVNCDDVTNRKSRMISMDINGESVHIFPTTGMVSHIGWNGPEHVVAYCRVRDFDDQYVLFKDRQKDQMQVLGPGLFRSDGHPSFTQNRQWMITDMYPDRRRLQTLILYDMASNCRYDLARLYTHRKYQSPSPQEHWTCDLHPRWDRTGQYVCFDATYTGKRSLCTIDLGSPIGVGSQSAFVPLHL